MAASSEQANAWRPGREEAVKAMGLVRGMVYSSRRETPTGEKEQQGRGGGRQGLHCGEANPNQRLGEKNKTQTRDWGGPQVRDPVPIVSVNPEADPPQPSAPVRPNRAEQDVIKTERQRQPPWL